VLRVLEPALRMEAQADSSSRDCKDFIYRVEKDCIVGTAGDQETSGQGRDWVFIAFFVQVVRVGIGFL
jgi:hypothetical protein